MPDFGQTAQDYARHRQGFPAELFERLQAVNVLKAGDRALDLGTGTGTLARGIAKRGLEVIGIDISPALLAEAARLSIEQGLNIEFMERRAEDSGFGSHRFDLISAGQCWHWFDRPKVAAECRRQLVPGGRLLIVHLDWLDVPGNAVDRTLKTMATCGARVPAALDHSMQGIYPQWTLDARAAGFEDLETFSFDLDLDYSHEAWRGRIRASAGVGGTLDAASVARFDAQLAEALEDLPAKLAVPHRVWALLARAPRAS